MKNSEDYLDLIKKCDEELAALKDCHEKVRDGIDLRRKKITCYSEMFKKEENKKYREKMIKEYQSIFYDYLSIKSYTRASREVLKIIRLYEKLDNEDGVKEWRGKYTKLLEDQERQPSVVINKIEGMKRSIQLLEKDPLHDELEIMTLRTKLLTFYSKLYELKVDASFYSKYYEEYTKLLSVVINKLYNQQCYNEVLDHNEKLIEVFKYLCKNEEVTRCEKMKERIRLLEQTVVVNTLDATGPEMLRDKMYDRYTLEKTPGLYSNVCCAAERGDRRAVKYALLRGQLDSHDWSKSIHSLCTLGKVEELEAMMSLKCEISFFDKNGNLPIHTAVINDQKSIVELLLDRNNGMRDIRTKGEKSVLEVAIERDRGDIIKLLVDRGVDVNSKMSDGDEAIVFALRTNRLAAVEQLLKCSGVFSKGESINKHSRYGHAPMHYAVISDNVRALEFLISKGADVNNRNLFGFTPLELAACMDRMHITKRLELGKTKDSTSNKGLRNAYERYMIAAIQAGNIGDVQRTFNKLDDGNFISSRFRVQYLNIVHFSVICGQENILKLFIERKGNINFKLLASHKDVEGCTAVHRAVMANKSTLIDLLVDNFVDVNSQDANGRTPLHHAARYGKNIAAEALLKQFINLDVRDSLRLKTPLLLAIQHGHTNIAKMIIEKGADLSVVGCNGESPLHLAVLHNNYEIVELLLEKRANVDACDIRVETPLHLAVMHNNLPIIKLLIDKQANIDFVNCNGERPEELSCSDEIKLLFEQLQNQSSMLHPLKCSVEGSSNVNVAPPNDSGLFPSSSVRNSKLEQFINTSRGGEI